ncbi:MAG TPA: hypothetical protein VN864_03485 [Thermoplasmata archaeon]|nr:hypothetical protein [Thermoplasmata archaeon]
MRSVGQLVPLLLVAVLVVAMGIPTTRAAPAPLNPSLYGRFLSNLSMPTLAPGDSGPVGFSLGDALGTPITGVTLTFDVYAFNAYPGNATGPAPADGAPLFAGASGAPSSSITLSVGSLSPNGPMFASPGAVDLTVAAPAGSPQGTYAVRTSLAFTSNGSDYLLESRGYFSASEWANATAAPHSPSYLNATRLGVSGVLPESAVLVRSNPYPLVLAIVLGGSVVLAALGGYWAVRWRPGSKSGAVAGPPPNHADTAFGKSRKSDGD